MELIEQFLQWKRFNQGRAEGTSIKYRLYLTRLNDYLLCDLLDAKREQLELFVGLEAHKTGMAPRSRRAMVAAVRGFYTWLLREEKIKVNPADLIEYPDAGNKLPTAASLRTAEKLLMAPDLETFKGIRDTAILAVLIGSGLRISGLCRLNESNLLWVEDADKSERLVIRMVEKGNKERMVPLTAEVRLLVRAYLGHRELKGISRVLPDGDKVLFVSLRNRSIPDHDYYGERRRISPRSISDMIKLYGEQEGLPADQLHPHAMRHLFGTELAESDIDLVKSQVLLGHADPKTSAVYMKLALRKLSKIVDLASPIRKIKTPVSEIVQRLEKNK